MSDWLTEACRNSAEKRGRESEREREEEEGRDQRDPEHDIRFGTNGAWDLVFV